MRIQISLCRGETDINRKLQAEIAKYICFCKKSINPRKQKNGNSKNLRKMINK